MVVFEGRISTKARKNACRYFLRKIFLGNFIILLVMGIPSLIIYLNSGVWFFIVVVLASCPLSFLLFFIERDKILPLKILVNSSTIEIWYKNDKQELTYVDLIESVVDKEEFYEIAFSAQGEVLVCQKDLIVQGTIEEFEEIFKDKIVRKQKQ